MTLKARLSLYFFAFVGLIVWLIIAPQCQRRTDQTNTSLILSKNDVAKIVIDPLHRRMTTIKDKGSQPPLIQTVTLPDRPSSIEILKNGQIIVHSPQFGTEFRPFGGVGYSLNGGFVALGIDGLYWKRLDLGGGFTINPSQIKDSRLFVGVSYFVYSNTSAGLGLDHKQTPLLFIKTRF
jgi:hypothetical protein